MDYILRNSAPYPIDDLSPFVYPQGFQSEGFYYIPQAARAESNQNDLYYVAAPPNDDGSSGDYVSSQNPTPPVNDTAPVTANTSNFTAPTQSTSPNSGGMISAAPQTTVSNTPPPNITIQPISSTTSTTTQTSNPIQSITNIVDNIVGITNNDTTVDNTTSVSSSDSTSTNTANISVNEDGSVNVPSTSDGLSDYTRPVLIGGVVGMIVGKLVKKDPFWGFVFGAGALSLYKYYRTQQINS